MRPAVARLVTISIIVLNLQVTTAMCAEPELQLDHKTLYFSQEVAGGHRFELKGTIRGVKGTGTLLIDNNSCELNEFGDRTICTTVLYNPIKVSFERLRLVDPTKQDREVYSVSGPDLPPDLKVTLVSASKVSPPVLRLVIAQAKHATALDLLPNAQPDQAP